MNNESIDRGQPHLMGEMLPWCMKEMEYDDIRKERVEIKAIDSSCSSYQV